MVKYKKKKTSKAPIVFLVLVLFLIVGCVGGFVYFRTNGFKSELKSFYLQCGEQRIVADVENFDMSIGEEYRFDIINEKDILTKSNTTYKISVVPNVTSTTTFEFDVNGKKTLYSDVDSLTNGFIVNTNDDNFTIRPTTDLVDILKEKYSTDNITNCPTAINSELPYFRLVVLAVDSNQTLNINFNIKGI